MKSYIEVNTGITHKYIYIHTCIYTFTNNLQHKKIYTNTCNYKCTNIHIHIYKILKPKTLYLYTCKHIIKLN